MLFSKNIWIGEADLVTGEGVEGLGGGLLQTREVLRLELGLGLLGERGPHLHAGGGGVGLHQSDLGIVTPCRPITAHLGRVVRARRQEDGAVRGQRPLEVADPLEVVDHEVGVGHAAAAAAAAGCAEYWAEVTRHNDCICYLPTYH